GRRMGSGDGLVETYLPERIQSSDYYAYGLELPGRKYENSAFSGTNSYRYGFNGKELDKSDEFSSLTHYDYGFRIYNPSIGKFLSVDPLTKSYPMLTPYQFASNSPIANIDLDGLEAWYYMNSAGFFLKDPVISGPYDPNIMNQNGYYSEAQARQFTDQSARSYINRDNQQKRVQQAEAYNLIQKRKNPVYGAVEAIHELGPTGSISGAITNFSEGNIGKGIVFSTFALLDLGYITKISAVAKSTGSRGIGAAGDFIGIENKAIRNVNHVNGVRIGNENCVGAAIAVDATIKGRAATALPNFFNNIESGAVALDLTEMFGRSTGSNFMQMVSKIQNAGHGTTGIVTSIPGQGKLGHAFNIVNDGGTVRILDGQIGREVPINEWSDYLKRFNHEGGFNLYNTTGK
nr:RHS repeat-associated core domain-containing protein [Saprospiraceae bacterium]